jgi:hypothetical protein
MALGATLVLQTPEVKAQTFIRGDTDVSATVDFSDAILTLKVLFLGQGAITCRDAADANDNGDVDFTDAIFTLEFLFLGSQIIPAPTGECGADPTPDAIGCDQFVACQPQLTESQAIGHLLNRIAYGPTLADIEHIQSIGIDAYVEEQLQPETIDESDNDALTDGIDRLTSSTAPAFEDSIIVPRSGVWKYFKGTQAPPVDWTDVDFDDTTWTSGALPIGYGDGGEGTLLSDMSGSYTSVYVRRTFNLEETSSIDSILLSVKYDDGFAAYLNGTELVRSGVSGSPPAHTSTAGFSHEAGTFTDWTLNVVQGLRVGTNVIAIQVHNRNLINPDLALDAEVAARRETGTSEMTFTSISALQASVHVRGIYSRRQLQVVLADFWENHFTTQWNKVVGYLDELQDFDGTDALTAAEAQRAATILEAREYEFFLDNALGNFGDMVRFSATSPTMLIYLDNVLNFKAQPNENYARELLELHCFGVDNGYLQSDIEECARAFTGWGVCKVSSENVDDPFATCGVEFVDDVILDLGSGWKYFKGVEEPTPGPGNEPTIAWAQPDFNDSTWLDGSTGIGYDDGDDATVLSDMKDNYISVYLRRHVDIPDPSAIQNLVLAVYYDDGFVAYLNGVEVARSETLEGDGNPPPYNRGSGEQEALNEFVFSLASYHGLMVPGDNVFAIQLHNRNIDSSDASMRPRLVDRTRVAGTLDNGDPGEWAFSFDFDEHDVVRKLLFRNRPYEVFQDNIPGGGTAEEHFAQSMALLDTIINAAPTAEFICTKLVQKFVSDDVPAALLAACLAAWNTSTPKGNIEDVMRVILNSDEFWSVDSYRAKIKDGLEYVNSTVRILEGAPSMTALPGYLDNLGMQRFTREEPDGWPEEGYEWITTNGLIQRGVFSSNLAAGLGGTAMWDTLAFIEDNAVVQSENTAADIVSFFNDVLFQGTLAAHEEQILIEYLNTDVNGAPATLSPNSAGFEARVRDAVSLMLSFPGWHLQ